MQKRTTFLDFHMRSHAQMLLWAKIMFLQLAVALYLLFALFGLYEDKLISIQVDFIYVL